MEHTHLQIGEFSKLCGVTVKTLHHYEKIGILLPSEVDEWTGYRYYSLPQMQTMEMIRKLKEAGFSLEEIGDLLDAETKIPTMELIEAKIRQTEASLHQMVMRRDRLKGMLRTQEKYKNMEKFTIQRIPAMVVASHRQILPSIDNLGEICYNIIGPEMARLGCQCPEPGYCYSIQHDAEFKEQDIDIEYCEMVTEAKENSDIIKFYQVEEIPMAACLKVYGPYNRLYQGYLDIFAQLEKEGYKMTGAARISYVDGAWNQSDPEKWMSIIQVPVEKISPARYPSTNRLKLYGCPSCGHIALTYGPCQMVCCQHSLDTIPIKKADENERPTVTESDGGYLLEYNHPMTKEFYIAGVVAERYDRVELIRLFPEQEATIRIEQMRGCKIYTIYRQGDKLWASRM